jgi:hypothetical protein
MVKKDIEMDPISKFCAWVSKEVRENDLVTLGPYRLAATHSTQKRYVISAEIWLKRMTNHYNKNKTKEDKMSVVDTANEFNQLIETGEIENFIVRSDKRIIRDAINEKLNTNQSKEIIH